MISCNNLIWDEQLHCQISLQLAAEELFDSLDERLHPKVFMIGVRIADDSNKAFINLECKDCDYCVADFLSLQAIPKIIHPTQKDVKIGVSAYVANGYLSKIQQVLRNHSKRNVVESFISNPAYINGYLVFVVTELSRAVMNTYYTLTKDFSTAAKTLKISRSFIESIIKTYLNASTNALKAKSQSEFKILSKSRDELVSSAAHDFMVTVSAAGQNTQHLHMLYDACNTISSLKYEGEEGLGKMIVASINHKNVELIIALEEPIHIKDFRKVRKFLELADHKNLLISDSVFIYGLGKLTGKYNYHEESLFVIHFTKHFHWEVLHHDKIMLSVAFRMPSFYSEQINKERFYSTLSRVFKTIQRGKLNKLWGITVEATKQKHGTILVISDAAKEESSRLVDQSFKIKPVVLTKNMVHQVTSIDGAVLLDTDCFCHGIGVILDGIASSYGDSSRGARFNSAVRYYEFMEKKAGIVVVVISEDGMINLIPELKPQVMHSHILKKIGELRALVHADYNDRRRFNIIMEFFSHNHFYFSEKECEVINALKATLEHKYRFIDGVKMIYDNFEPNKKMNSSYYLKEINQQ
ncbi:DNA integrity scanning protein DisA nucleotide-binding domain protein [Pedobacter rhodius]|uniref:Diadenylate cyclase n=1 Tax=Pedobacter rhodius TaxID=3004098 RepID=A0ABT4KT55_9SPHI|nr:diadenylate cyclase [Pedobacter sp. SJ11]MCZ4222108.1 diadenylate cyclase [Pedobacter sp. SJ11]